MKSLVVLIFSMVVLGLNAQNTNNEVQTFYENGMVKTTYRYTSPRNYEFTNYYPSGMTMETGRFVNGRMDGNWISYAENGIRISEGIYRNGEKNGEWKIYGDLGTVRYKVYYENNRIVNASSINANSNSIAELHTH